MGGSSKFLSRKHFVDDNCGKKYEKVLVVQLDTGNYMHTYMCKIMWNISGFLFISKIVIVEIFKRKSHTEITTKCGLVIKL